MRLMIASDIHGSAYYCRRLIEAFERKEADRLLLLGDKQKHKTPKKQTKEYAPKEVIKMLNELKNSIFCVRGNCDTEVDQMVLEFPVMADYCIMPAGSRLVYVTHGHNFNTEHFPQMQSGDILLHGHTHIPAWEPFGNDNLYLNPGSVSIPKAESKHSYMVMNESEFTWHSLDGEIYHKLDL